MSSLLQVHRIRPLFPSCRVDQTSMTAPLKRDAMDCIVVHAWPRGKRGNRRRGRVGNGCKGPVKVRGEDKDEDKDKDDTRIGESEV